MQKKADKIKVLLSLKGWKVGAFADAIGYDRASFSRAINADKINAKLLAKIAEKLGIDPALITSDEEIGPGNMPALGEVERFDNMSEEELSIRNELARLKKENAELREAQAKLIDVVKNLSEK